MFQAICNYIDRLVAAARPRKLLMMAIDGVAPRAKMNQQRSRRFKAAAEIKARDAAREEICERLQKRGLRPPAQKTSTFDHNVITPGTTFMFKLALHLRYYVAKRMNDPATAHMWKHLRVIISDASVPGEGEHKIMEYIRQQRASEGYSPNTHHILHGLDADLIMLGLATHEPNFTIFREDVLPPKGNNTCFKCGQSGHRATDCSGPIRSLEEKEGKKAVVPKKPLQFLHLSTLREYLDIEFSNAFGRHIPWSGPASTQEGEREAYGDGAGFPNGVTKASLLPFSYDLERIIDDFVLLCFFVGNDFLPSIPSLDIREGAIDLMMSLYKNILPTLGGYLTFHGNVHLGRVDVILSKLSVVEEEIFRRRRVKEGRDAGFQQRRKDENARKPLNERQKAIKSLTSPSATPTPTPTEGVIGSAVSSIDTEKALQSAMLKQRRVVESETDSSGQLVTPKSTAAAGSTAGTTKEKNFSAAESLREILRKNKMATAAVPFASDVAKTGSLVNTDVDAVVDKAEAEVEKAEADALAAPNSGAGEESSPHVGAKRSRPEEGEDTAQSTAVTAPSPLVVPNVSAESPSGFSEVKNETPASEALDLLESEIEDACDVTRFLTSRGEGDEGEEDFQLNALLKDAVEAVMLEKATHEDIVDEIELGAHGWRDRYYAAKFGEEFKDPDFLRRLCLAYTEGLVWVYRYYYQGVSSWKWFYPYHYAPFAMDLKGLEAYEIKFELGRPFRPLDQLMGVLPSLSAHALPAAAARLMTAEDSPIIDFYPVDFKEDPNGKKFSWLWVVLLPFIDEKRLLAAIDGVAHTFTPDELERNEIGNEILMVHVDSELGKMLRPLAPTQEDVELLSRWHVDENRRKDVFARRAKQIDEEKAVIVNVSDADGSGDARIVSTPAISPAVTEALANVTDRIITIRATTADVDGKGIGGRCVPLAVGANSGYICPLGDTYKSPSNYLFPPIPNNKVLQVCLLPPVRKAHLCNLLSNVIAPPPRLVPEEDDPSSTVPRLTRGITIVDLLHACLAGSVQQGRNNNQYGDPRYRAPGGSYPPSGQYGGYHAQSSPYGSLPAHFQYGTPQGQADFHNPLVRMANSNMHWSAAIQNDNRAHPQYPQPPAQHHSYQIPNYRGPPPTLNAPGPYSHSTPHPYQHQQPYGANAPPYGHSGPRPGLSSYYPPQNPRPQAGYPPAPYAQPRAGYAGGPQHHQPPQPHQPWNNPARGPNTPYLGQSFSSFQQNMQGGGAYPNPPPVQPFQQPSHLFFNNQGANTQAGQGNERNQPPSNTGFSFRARPYGK